MSAFISYLQIKTNPSHLLSPSFNPRYSDLETCYNVVFQKTTQVTNGAAFFLQGIQSCYGAYAYVYKSTTEVYNLTLGNVSHGQFVTPMLDQYIYDLPPGMLRSI